MSKWFDIDKRGLQQTVARRGKTFIVYEFYQNAVDEDVTHIEMELKPIENRPACELTIKDNSPRGFFDISHAFTMFAPSAKRKDPVKRGRFNIGEKMALACCESAKVVSVNAAVEFPKNGDRRNIRERTQRGTVITATVPMTRAEYDEVCAAALKIIPPPGVEVIFNGTRIKDRKPIVQFEENLLTEVEDEDGNLRRRMRIATVRVYEPEAGEMAAIYELGIPVVETGDKYHVDVEQKVPLNLDRDNVPPSFLQALRTTVLNHTLGTLDSEDATAAWVRNATEDKQCTPAVVDGILTLRFGKKRVIADLSDPEATKIAMSEGYAVIHGGALSSDQWARVKECEAALPAGKVTPSPKTWTGQGNPSAGLFDDWIPPEKWSAGMRGIAEYARTLGQELLLRDIDVRFCSTAHHLGIASYRPGELTFNKFRLGNDWFEKGVTDEVEELLIHEFGHEYSGDHLSAEYHEALCKLAVRFKNLALKKPQLFRRND